MWTEEEFRLMDAHDYPAWYWDAETPDSKRVAYIREAMLRDGLPPQVAEEEARYVLEINRLFSDLATKQATAEHQEAIAERVLSRLDPKVLKEIKEAKVLKDYAQIVTIMAALDRLHKSPKTPPPEDGTLPAPGSAPEKP